MTPKSNGKELRSEKSSRVTNMCMTLTSSFPCSLRNCWCSLLFGFFLSSLMYQSVPSFSSVLLFVTPTECSMPGFPVYHQFPELTQTHVHRVGDAIQSSHPLSSPSFPASIFPTTRVFSHKSVLRIRWPKYWSFSFSINPSNEYSELISFRMDWLDLLAVSKGLSRVFSNITVQKHQFFGTQLSLWSNSHIHTWLLEKP